MITYLHSADSIAPADLCGFFVGWAAPPSPETHLKLLKNSDHIVLAFDDKGRRVVGFVTAISDGVLSAYIPLLEVLPSFRGQGIGQEMMRQILQQLRGLYMVDLLCDPELQSFYEQFGMRPATGMMLRDHRRQAGGQK